MNTITATFKPGSKTVTAPALYQWDYGQVLILEGLELPDSYEVHFSNKQECGDAEVRIGNADGVMIPDVMLETGEPVYAFVFLHSDTDDGETVYLVSIQVKKRPKPFYGTPSAAQQSAITEAIAALNAAVLKAEGFATDAETSAASAEESMTAAQEAKTEAENAAAAAAEYSDVTYEYSQSAESFANAAEVSAQNADASAQTASAAEGNAYISAQEAASSEYAAAQSALDAAQARAGIDTVVRASLEAAKQSGEFRGEKGDTGAVFVPSISSSGVLSWSNNGGLRNPDSVDMVSVIVNALPIAEEAKF